MPEQSGMGGRPLSRVGEVVLLASAALTIMAGAAIAPALPGVADHFGVDPERDVRVKLLLTLPALVIALTAPVMGWLVDSVGRRPVLTVGFVAFGLTGAAGLVIDDLQWLLLSRVGMGLSVAALVTATSTLIADFFTGDERSRLIGRQSIYMSGGSILFLLTGGWLAGYGWRVPFSVYLVGFVFLILARCTIPEPDQRRLPPTPANPGNGISSEDSARLFQPSVFLILLAGITGMIAFYQVPVQLPFFLKSEFHATPMMAGSAIALSTVFSALMATQFSRGLRKLGHPLVMALALCAVGAALSGIGLAVQPWMMGLSLALLGCGLGWMMPNLSAWMGHAAPARVRGRAMGLLSAALFLGQFLAPLVASPILRGGGGFRSVFAIIGMGATLMGLAFLGAAMSDWIRRRRVGLG